MSKMKMTNSEPKYRFMIIHGEPMMPGDMFVCPACAIRPTILSHWPCDVCKSNWREGTVVERIKNVNVYCGRYRRMEDIRESNED